MEIQINTVEEMGQLATQVAPGLKPEADQALVLCLYGDLGAGKTTFVQALAQVLGITERVISPTFVIEKIYHLPSGSEFSDLIHIDTYRLENSLELNRLGFSELVQDPTKLIVLEWPEKVFDLLPPKVVNIYFKFINESVRQVTYGQ